MPRVSVEAVFKEIGLDRLKSGLDQISAKMRRVGDAMRSWGAGGPSQGQLGKQFAMGAEFEKHGRRIAELKGKYIDLLGQYDKANSPGRRSDLQNRMRIIQAGAHEAMVAQEGLNKSLRGESAALVSSTMLRRGFRLGLGLAGLPMTIAGLARGMGEAHEQEKMTLGMATRLSEFNQQGRDFTSYVIDMRQQIVRAGAEFAYSGREAIQLADSLTQVSGNMMDMRTVYEMSRGLGMAPQTAGQVMAYARRFGGTGAMPDEKLAEIVSSTIMRTGMMPRGNEFAQTLVQAMQQAATRLPSVEPQTLLTLLGTLSQEWQGPGEPGVGRLAPTLKGAGGASVIQSLDQMMGRMDEAMVAVQSQIVTRHPELFKDTIKKMGLKESDVRSGVGAYDLMMALKTGGVAAPDGLKFAGETIRLFTRGQALATRVAFETSLLPGLTTLQVSALEKSKFMDKLRSGEMTTEKFQKEMERRFPRADTMNVPGVAYASLARAIGASFVSKMEATSRPGASWARATGEMLNRGEIGLSDLPGMAAAGLFYGAGKGAAGARQSGAGSWLSGKNLVGLGTGLGMGGLLTGNVPAMVGGLGAFTLGKGLEEFPGVEKKIQHSIDITVRLSEMFDKGPSGVGWMIGSVIVKTLEESLFATARGDNARTGKNGSPAPGVGPAPGGGTGWL